MTTECEVQVWFFARLPQQFLTKPSKWLTHHYTH
jgi:hypothetical protein